MTCRPTDFWLALHFREETPFGQAPYYLIHDHSSNYGETFAHVATSSGIIILKKPYSVPKANAIYERFMGSLRRKCLDHLLILSTLHLHRIFLEYVTCFNRSRPHQGIGQDIPEPEDAQPIEVIASARLSAARYWVACTMIIVEWLKFEGR